MYVCMYVCMYIYTYIYIHICIYVHVSISSFVPKKITIAVDWATPPSWEHLHLGPLVPPMARAANWYIWIWKSTPPACLFVILMVKPAWVFSKAHFVFSHPSTDLKSPWIVPSSSIAKSICGKHCRFFFWPGRPLMPSSRSWSKLTVASFDWFRTSSSWTDDPL